MGRFTLDDVAASDAETGDAEANQTGDIDTSEIDVEEERSLFERIKAAPQAIADAVT